MWLGFGIMWASVSAAVSVGLCMTRSPWCLWAFLLPALAKVTYEKNGRGEKDEKSKGD